MKICIKCVKFCQRPRSGPDNENICSDHSVRFGRTCLLVNSRETRYQTNLSKERSPDPGDGSSDANPAACEQ